MLKPNGGRLLEKIAYCLKKSSYIKNIIDEPLEVSDAFPYNPDSKTAPDTAKRWALGMSYWNVETSEPKIVIRDNEPFEVTIVDLHVRSSSFCSR